MSNISLKRTSWVQYLIRSGLFWLLLSGLVQASDVPMATNYQGYLESSGGEPLDATVNISFALYDAAQGGSVVWTESHSQVKVSNGVFHLVLGSVNPFQNSQLAGERYLGITVGSDAEMSPRQPLTSAFYAMRACSSKC